MIDLLEWGVRALAALGVLALLYLVALRGRLGMRDSPPGDDYLDLA